MYFIYKLEKFEITERLFPTTQHTHMCYSLEYISLYIKNKYLENRELDRNNAQVMNIRV